MRSARDLHSALKTDIIDSSQANSIDLRLVRLQWGKEDVALSLHAAPNSYTSAGIQLTDFFSYLGFVRTRCHFVQAAECFVRWVNDPFDLQAFGAAVTNGFGSLTGASRDLEACGSPAPARRLEILPRATVRHTTPRISLIGRGWPHRGDSRPNEGER